MAEYTPVRIGLLTDPHYADINPNGNRHFRDALFKVRDAVTYFNTQPLDFIAELGDLKDKHATDALLTTGCLGTIEGELRKANAEVAHVLGNHDMDMLSKAQFLSHITNLPGAVYPDNTVDKSYYSFVIRGIKFIVLDACFTKNNDPYKGDAAGTNYTYREARVPPKEQHWLKMELASPYPVIILAHQLLDFWNKPAADPDTVVLNAAEVVQILEDSGKVAAVFQGHHHAGHYSTRNGIHYVTLKGMVEGQYPSSTSYAVATIDASLNITWDGFGNEPDRTLPHPAP
jgi:alkaline phosphatase